MRPPLVDVVDDDPANQKLLRLLAEQAGCRVRTHVSAESALAAARDEAPVVAVIDVQLSGRIDGLALVRQLRATPATAATWIIVVSAFAGLADEMWARVAGCDLWLPKPIDTREFLLHLSQLTAASDRGEGA